MEKHTIGNHRSGRIVSGLIILAVGLIFLLKNFGLNIPDWIISWHTALLFIGLFIGIRHRFHGGGWLVMVLIGGYFTAEDLVDFDFKKYYLAVVFIILGLYLILKPKKSYRHDWHRERWNRQRRRRESWNRGRSQDIDSGPESASFEDPVSEEEKNYINDTIDSVNVFGGSHQKVYSKNFKGGDVIAIFGGCELNLTQADFQDTVAIDVVAIFGGVKVIIPQGWEVKAEVTPIFGGVDDKRTATSFEGDSRKLLIIEGVALFGGVEIRNF